MENPGEGHGNAAGRAKEGVILDEHGSGGPANAWNSGGRSSTAYAGRTPIAWGGGGILPKIILAVVVGALLFLGFGIVAIVLAVMLVTFILRTLYFMITGAPRPPRSKFTFIVKR